MGFLSNVFGSGGNKFKAKEVPVLQGATTDQINSAMTAGQGLTGQQQATADMLAGRATNATPIDFSGANTSIGNANQILAQLMATGQGQGPNPALEQLRQTTGQNIQQATGLVASQKGINPALAARTAALSAAQANQGAAGQAAVLSAQQQLAAQQQAAGLATTISGQQAGMAQAQGAQQAQNIAQLMQQQQAMGGMNLQEQQLLQQALAQYNSARVGQQNAVNQTNAQVAMQNAQTGNQLLGGILNAAGSVAGLAMLAEGGEVPEPGEKPKPKPKGKRSDKEVAAEALEKIKGKKGGKGRPSDKEIAAQAMMHRLFGDVAPEAPRYAEGDVVGAQPDLTSIGLSAPLAPGLVSAYNPTPTPVPNGPASTLGKLWASRTGGQKAAGLAGVALGGLGAGFTGGPNTVMQTIQAAAPRRARGGETPETFVSNGSTPEVVPGKATVPYGKDSESADRTLAWLTPGEGVLPRSVMQAPDAPEKARDFVAHLVATRRPGGRAKAAFGERRASR